MKSPPGSQPERRTVRRGNPSGAREMAVETSEAAAPTTTPNITRNNLAQDYSNCHAESRPNPPDRDQAIAQRRAQYPKKYRRIYDKAIEGRSLRACVNAQCLDCCAGQSREIARCTDLACPLYAVRPYRDSGSARDGGLTRAESRNSRQRIQRAEGAKT